MYTPRTLEPVITLQHHKHTILGVWCASQPHEERAMLTYSGAGMASQGGRGHACGRDKIDKTMQLVCHMRAAWGAAQPSGMPAGKRMLLAAPTLHLPAPTPHAGAACVGCCACPGGCPRREEGPPRTALLAAARLQRRRHCCCLGAGRPPSSCAFQETTRALHSFILSRHLLQPPPPPPFHTATIHNLLLNYCCCCNPPRTKKPPVPAATSAVRCSSCRGRGGMQQPARTAASLRPASCGGGQRPRQLPGSCPSVPAASLLHAQQADEVHPQQAAQEGVGRAHHQRQHAAQLQGGRRTGRQGPGGVGGLWSGPARLNWEGGSPAPCWAAASASTAPVQAASASASGAGTDRPCGAPAPPPPPHTL